MSTDLRIVGGRDVTRKGRGDTPADGESARILATLGCAAWEWDIGADTLTWSANASELLGLTDDIRLSSGAGFRRLVSPRSPHSRDELTKAARGPEAAGRQRTFTLRYELSLPGGLVPVEDTGKLFLDDVGRVTRAAGLLRMLTRTDTQAIEGATGLATAARVELMDWIARSFASAKREGATFGLIVMSVAGLSLVEDTNGTEVADQLAANVLARLRVATRTTDKALRFATNRFAVLLPRADADTLTVTATRMAEAVGATPIATEAGLIPISLTCGAIIGPNFARDPRTLLRRCEEALERARRESQPLRLYEPDRVGEAARLRTQALSDDVIRALNDGRLVLARQPIVLAASRVPAFEEALLRMVREDGAIVGAGAIIPTFEQLGRIELLDCRVLELATEALVGEPKLSLSINVSAATLRGGAWMARFTQLLTLHPEIAARLVVEMTESQAIEDEAVAKRAFSEIRARGARTAIDDFGAGYTSFRHLRGLDVDIVKIDGGFVQNIGACEDDAFFVRTLVELARRLGIETVAEWVRDEAAAELLASWGVDYLQGDCLGPAVILAPVDKKLLEAVA